MAHCYFDAIREGISARKGKDREKNSDKNVGKTARRRKGSETVSFGFNVREYGSNDSIFSTDVNWGNG